MPCAHNTGCPNSPDKNHCWHSTYNGPWRSIVPPPSRCCWCHATASTSFTYNFGPMSGGTAAPAGDWTDNARGTYESR